MLTKESLARIEDAIAGGFSDAKAILANQHVLIQSLLETRQRQQSVMRWVAGVVATAGAAIVLAAIKLRG